MKFVDFNLTIRPVGDGLMVSFADPRGFIIDELIPPPPPPQEVTELRDKVEKDAQTTALTALRVEQAITRGAVTEADEKLREVGEKLFNWVFRGKVLNAFKAKHATARRHQQGLRIRLSIDPSHSAIGVYPFEVMFCPEMPIRDHLALFGDMTIVRSLTGSWLENPEAIEPPLRILIVGASPQGLPPLNVRREIEDLKRALNLPGIKVESVEECTLERLGGAAKIEKPHVLHFIGHGEFDDKTKEGKIFLVDERGGQEPVSGEMLRRELNTIPSLRLVTLNACLGNASAGNDPFSSVAACIFSLQLPAAVVAMQFRITDLAAVEFSQSFYSQLAQGRPVDEAISSARAHVRRKIKGSPEWATPILYLGTPDGDFLGLRLPLDQLLEHALSQLRGGNWDIAKSTATLALEQHSEARGARDVLQIADECEQFSDTYAQVFKVLRLGSGEYPAGTLKKLAELGEKIQAEDFRRVLGDDLGKCGEVIRMAAAVAAFCAGEFDRAAEVCEQSPPGDLFDFNLIGEHARAERDARNELKWLEQVWSTGDWKLAIEAAEKQSTREAFKRTRVYPEIERKRAVVRELRRAAEALARDDLKRAHASMSEIAVEDAPGNFELSKRVVSIGVRAAEAADAGDMGSFATLRDEFDATLSQVDAALAPEIPGVQQVQNFLSKTSSEMDYQAGLDLYAKGFFTESQRLFTRLGGYKDAAEKAASCAKWKAVIESLQARQWDEAKRLLVDLRAQDKSPRAQSYLRWCNWVRMAVPVLEAMAASPLVYDPLLPWEGAENPYKLFAPLGVLPTSRMEHCKSEVGFELQGKFAGMDEGERKVWRNAWDALRLNNKRLLLDFLLYRVIDQERPRALAERLCAVEEGKELRQASTQELISELKEDAGVFLILRRDYDQAISFFLQEAAARPYDATTLHHLGLSAAAKIHLLEEHGGDEDQLAQAWEHLIHGWAATFANDAFWHYWWSDRRRIYDAPVSSEEIEDARLQLQRLWSDRIKSATDICAGLDITFQSELKGATAVNTGKGIPLPEHPDKVSVLGFIGAKTLDLSDAVARWAESFGADSLRSEGWQRWTCHYFSELAEPLTLFHDGRYEEAIETLTRPRCELLRRNDPQCEYSVLNEHYPQVAAASCPCFASANPAFSRLPQGGKLLAEGAFELLEKAHSQIALAAISSTPTNNSKALKHWRIAVELARQRGGVEDLLAHVRDVIVGRSNFLVSSLQLEDENHCMYVLDDVIELLQLSCDERWDDSERVLRHALTEHLLSRATYLAYKLENYEEARRDANLAYGLESERLKPISVLSKINIAYSGRLYDRGQKDMAEALLEEIEEVLRDADQKFPDNSDITSCYEMLERYRKYMKEVGEIPPLERLNRESMLLNTDASQGQQKLNKLMEATYNEAQKQYAEAIKLYDEILRSEPDNAEARARMEYCYRSWIYDTWDSSAESLDKVREIAHEALGRFPDSELLSPFAKKIGGREEAQ